VQGIYAREMFPGFERIWIDCIQEETQLVSREDTNGLSVMTMVIFLHSVHTGGEGEEGNRHQQQRLMRLQTGSRGRSCWSPPFQVQFPAGGLGWWIAGASFHMTRC
jgi:hypothetical protein